MDMSRLRAHSPPSGRLVNRNQRSSARVSLRHSTTLTMSSSSLAFFFSTFMGYTVTELPSGSGAHKVHSSSMSGTLPDKTPVDVAYFAPQIQDEVSSTADARRHNRGRRRYVPVFLRPAPHPWRPAGQACTRRTNFGGGMPHRWGRVPCRRLILVQSAPDSRPLGGRPPRRKRRHLPTGHRESVWIWAAHELQRSGSAAGGRSHRAGKQVSVQLMLEELCCIPQIQSEVSGRLMTAMLRIAARGV